MKSVSVGPYVIRQDICNDRQRLCVYAKRSRTWAAGIGNASETKSGFWIVSIIGETSDVAKDRNQAADMLKLAIERRLAK